MSHVDGNELAVVKDNDCNGEYSIKEVSGGSVDWHVAQMYSYGDESEELEDAVILAMSGKMLQVLRELEKHLGSGGSIPSSLPDDRSWMLTVNVGLIRRVREILRKVNEKDVRILDDDLSDIRDEELGLDSDDDDDDDEDEDEDEDEDDDECEGEEDFPGKCVNCRNASLVKNCDGDVFCSSCGYGPYSITEIEAAQRG